MERYIDPSPLKGTVKAPSSKSMTQRAIAAALLADGQSTIHNPSYCDDSLAAMSIAVGLGARIEPHSDKMIVDGTGNLRESKLNCGESGLAIRMFSPIAALFPEKIILTGANSLRKRPMKMIEEALNQMGVSYTSSGGFLPLTIKGPIKGGRCEIDGSVSSQLLTGLLMALPLAQEDSEIKVNDLKSKPYIEMTIQILKSFGVTIHNENFSLFRIPGNQKYIPYDYTVEGDWSGGAFLLVAGAINGELTITGLQKASRQSDMTILDALRDAGAKMKISDDSVWISHSPLKAFSFDATHSPDLFPPLTVLAAYCDGVSTIKGVTRLIHKESNRAEALRLEFGKLKIMIDIDGDIMSITGGKPEGAKVESHDDHRITMAMAVAALKASGRVYIRDSQCVGKSYPGFFDDLRTLGATVHE
ncbi:MAG TPA: 3-phosphoshikimate 1-carboxyvinyltransferase [Bacteroidales bacterium]|nr:3-phosphoshikimate 1-carboxyvinyltransferase [Bacteroidales bacterium]